MAEYKDAIIYLEAQLEGADKRLKELEEDNRYLRALVINYEKVIDDYASREKEV